MVYEKDPLDPEVKIESFRLDLHLGATVSVNGEAWFKPGASSGITWKGGIPDQDQVKTAVKFISSEILDPVMTEVTEMIADRIRKTRGIE